MMKKLILSFIIILYATSLSLGQLKIGAKVGGVLSSISTSDELDGANNDLYESKIGYQIGGFLQLKRNKLVIQSELLWSNKGGKTAEDEQSIHLNYLSAPILIGFQPAERLSLLFGPELGYAISSRSEGNNINQFLDSDIDFSLNLGLDYQLKSGIGLGVRYNYGINSILSILYTNNQGATIGEANYHNRSIQLYVTYNFIK